MKRPKTIKMSPNKPAQRKGAARIAAETRSAVRKVKGRAR